MGIFKSMKDMKSMVAEAPGLIAQTQTLTANAQAMAEQHSAAATSAGLAAATGAEFAPIAGVSLELYVTISQRSAALGNDVAEMERIAGDQGVSGANWAAAVAGWNTRMQSHPIVAQRFSAIYTGR